MGRVLRLMGEVALYVVFAGVVAYLSTSPPYRPLASGMAVVKLAFGHQGQRKEPCRRRTDEELAALAPNMRAREVCPRERSPIRVELAMDGEVVHAESVPPTGLSRDGTAYVYRRITVPAGRHLLSARLRDSVRQEGFDYEHTQEVNLRPAEVLVIEFNAKAGGFRLVQGAGTRETPGNAQTSGLNHSG